MNSNFCRFFSADEFKRVGCSIDAMDENFLARLDAVREAAGVPLRLTSAYRTPAHNAAVSATGATGPHTTGRAVDIAIAGEDVFRLVGAAILCGMTGIGLRQAGPVEKRFVHLDDLTADRGYPRPRIWTY